MVNEYAKSVPLLAATGITGSVVMYIFVVTFMEVYNLQSVQSVFLK